MIVDRVCCSLCVLDALVVMVFSSLLLSSSSGVGFGCVEGVLLVCLVDVDRVFAPVDYVVSVAS